MKMDTDGDGRVTWRELISLMYHKYGKTVIKEMLSWDASDWEDVGQRKHKGGHQVIRFGPAQVAEIKNMFALLPSSGACARLHVQRAGDDEQAL